MSAAEKTLDELIPLRIAAEATLPKTRETALVLTNLEQAEMWLLRHIKTENTKQTHSFKGGIFDDTLG